MLFKKKTKEIEFPEFPRDIEKKVKLEIPKFQEIKGKPNINSFDKKIKAKEIKIEKKPKISLFKKNKLIVEKKEKKILIKPELELPKSLERNMINIKPRKIELPKVSLPVKEKKKLLKIKPLKKVQKEKKIKYIVKKQPIIKQKIIVKKEIIKPEVRKSDIINVNNRLLSLKDEIKGLREAIKSIKNVKPIVQKAVSQVTKSDIDDIEGEIFDLKEAINTIGKKPNEKTIPILGISRNDFEGLKKEIENIKRQKNNVVNVGSVDVSNEVKKQLLGLDKRLLDEISKHMPNNENSNIGKIEADMNETIEFVKQLAEAFENSVKVRKDIHDMLIEHDKEIKKLSYIVKSKPKFDLDEYIENY